MFHKFIDSICEGENDDDDDEIIFYDHPNICTKNFRHFTPAQDSSVNILGTERVEDTMPSDTASPITHTDYGVDKDIATMNRAVRVPDALRCAGRRTMFDVLVKLREIGDKPREEEGNLSSAGHKELDKNREVPGDLADSVQGLCKSQNNCFGVLEASAPPTGVDAVQDNLRRGLKHLLPRHLRKDEQGRIACEAPEEKRRREEESAMVLNISDFSSSASDNAVNDEDVGCCQPYGPRRGDPPIHPPTHMLLIDVFETQRFSFDAKQQDRRGVRSAQSLSSGYQAAGRPLSQCEPGRTTAPRSVWDVFQDKEEMAVREAQSQRRRPPMARTTALDTDPFLEVESSLAPSSARSTIGRVSAASGTEKSLNALLDAYSASDIAECESGGVDSLGMFLYRHEWQRLLSLNQLPTPPHEVDSARSLTRAHNNANLYNGILGKPMTLHIHSLASNTTGSSYTSGLPPPQSRGQLDKRTLRQLLKIPTALRVVEYLRQAFTTWALNGLLLREWWLEQQTQHKGGADTPQESSLLPDPQTSAQLKQNGVESKDICHVSATSNDFTTFELTTNKASHNDKLSQHHENHTPSKTIQGLEESGIHIAFIVLSIDTAYGLTHAYGELVWVHPSVKTRLCTAPSPSKAQLKGSNTCANVARGLFFGNPRGSFSEGEGNRRVLDSRFWTLVISDTVLRAVPVVVNHCVYLADPFFVFPDVRCILCSYNITSDVLVAEHGAAYESAAEAAGALATTPSTVSRKRRCISGGNVANGAGPSSDDPTNAHVADSTQGRCLFSGGSISHGQRRPPPSDGVRLSQGKAGGRSLAGSPSKDLYDPLAFPVCCGDPNAVEGHPPDAVASDLLGSGFHRGPGAEWEIPLEVLRTLSSVHAEDVRSSLRRPSSQEWLERIERKPSPERSEIGLILSNYSNTSYQLTAFSKACDDDRETAGSLSDVISSSLPTPDSGAMSLRR